MGRGVFHAAGTDEVVRTKVRARNYWRAPRADDIALITCHFNPCGFQRLRENYEMFAAEVARQGYELWTIEMEAGGGGNGTDATKRTNVRLPDAPRMVRVRSDSVLWHKERMLNRLVELLPAKYTKVAWVDHDVFFPGDNWLNAASALLDDVPVAQLYQGFEYLDPQGGVMKAFVSSASAPTSGTGQPGGALAARRELWTQAGGLPDRIITGGGDSFLMYALQGVKSPAVLKRYNAAVGAYYERCQARLFAWSGGVVGFLPGVARHRWHGELTNRRYVDRIALLKDYDPARDLALNDDRMWELTDGNEELQEGLRQYFLDRREDGEGQ